MMEFTFDKNEIEAYIESQRPMYTKLHELAYEGDADAVQEYIVEHSEWVNPPCVTTLSPIHIACFRGHKECVLHLMNADLSCLDTYTKYASGQSTNGWRALEFAYAGGHDELVAIIEDYRDDSDSEAGYPTETDSDDDNESDIDSDTSVCTPTFGGIFSKDPSDDGLIVAPGGRVFMMDDTMYKPPKKS